MGSEILINAATGAHFPAQTWHLEGSKIYYMHDSIIDHGATSIVYRGFFGDVSTKSAVKRLNSQHFLIYENELKIWKELQSETRSTENVHVVHLYDWTSQTVEENEIYYFCMERGKCNLEQRIKRISKSPQEQEYATFYITTMLQQAAQGLSWLHTRNIIHRDVKPHNILIFDTISGEIAKISDFGTCRKMSTLNTGTITSPCGTFGWMAPEALIAMNTEQPYTTTKAVDIFSFGMTCQYCYSHCISGKWSHLFVKSDKYKYNIAMNIEDEQVRPVELELPVPDHLFQWMMRKLPKDRPQISHVLQHPFFWNAEKSLKFLVDIAKCVDLTTDEMKMFRKKIDDECNPEKSLDWKSTLDEDVLRLIVQRKSKPNKSFDNVYDTSSVTSLCKLIRDKYVHHEDLVDELIDEKYFGVKCDNESYTFSEGKYAQYFAPRFQDVLMFLYKFIGNQDLCGNSTTGCLTSLVSKYNVLNNIVQYNSLDCNRRSQVSQVAKRYMDDEELLEFLNNRMHLDRSCQVIKPTMPMEFSDDFYCLPKGSKGHALILNNYEFSGELRARKGSEKETFYMSQLWGGLGYTLTVLTNFTHEELVTTLQSFKAKLSPDDASLVVYVGSHGELNTIYTADCVPVSIYQDIFYQFDSKNCPQLDGKPKIFVTQFDLTMSDNAFQKAEKFDMENAGGHMDDAIVCFATIPGAYSFRNTIQGGLFSYCLTKVFMEHAHRLDLISMLKKVQTLLKGVKLQVSSQNVRQLCTYQDLGIKTLYFNMEHEYMT